MPDPSVPPRPKVVSITPLDWTDLPAATLDTPKARLALTAGLGSGLARRKGDGRMWAISDRGPNVSVRAAARALGLDVFEALTQTAPRAAKVILSPDLGPELIALDLSGTTLSAAARYPLLAAPGILLGGLAPPEAAGADAREPLYLIDGTPIPLDASGADCEGLVAFQDGRFLIGEEYLPSLIETDAEGVVLCRHVPVGQEWRLSAAPYPVRGSLPAIAAARQLNRGFEAMALSADETKLYVAFQSALAHPDASIAETCDFVRVWTLHAVTFALLSEHVYALDPVDAFRRDHFADDPMQAGDRKLCEMILLPSSSMQAPDLLMLERGSQSSKLYKVTLDPAQALAPKWHLTETRPALEQIASAHWSGHQIFPLRKHLILDSDAYPEIPGDLEGLALLAPDTLLLVNDNDYGVAGVATLFTQIVFDRPL